MPISKELKAALDAWKAGTGEYPAELDNGVFFRNEGAYLDDVGKKSKSREGKAREEATADFLARLGLTNPEEIESVKAALEKSGVLKTEVEKVKGDLAKYADEIKKRDATIAEKDKAIGDLSGFKTKVLKTEALTPHLAKIAPDFRDLVSENLLGKIAVDEAGKIAGPEGKDISALVDDLIKAKPSLKAPDFKPAPGTKPTTEKPNLPFAKTEGGPELSVGQRAVNEMIAKGQIAAPAPSGQ
jgi:hypothetical protein